MTQLESPRQKLQDEEESASDEEVSGEEDSEDDIEGMSPVSWALLSVSTLYPLIFFSFPFLFFFCPPHFVQPPID